MNQILIQAKEIIECSELCSLEVKDYLDKLFEHLTKAQINELANDIARSFGFHWHDGRLYSASGLVTVNVAGFEYNVVKMPWREGLNSDNELGFSPYYNYHRRQFCWIDFLRAQL